MLQWRKHPAWTRQSIWVTSYYLSSAVTTLQNRCLDQFTAHTGPEQRDKVKANRDLIPNATGIIRWQNPPKYMRRTVLEDVEMHGKISRKGMLRCGTSLVTATSEN